MHTMPLGPGTHSLRRAQQIVVQLSALSSASLKIYPCLFSRFSFPLFCFGVFDDEFPFTFFRSNNLFYFASVYLSVARSFESSSYLGNFTLEGLRIVLARTMCPVERTRKQIGSGVPPRTTCTSHVPPMFLCSLVWNSC